MEEPDEEDDESEDEESEEPEEAPQDTVVAAAPMAEDTSRVNAANAYDELDGKSGPQVGESIPANVEDDSNESSIHWVPLSISAVALVAGTVLAVVGNNQAKTAADKGGNTVSDLKKNRDDAKTGQTLRAIGIGVAIAGAVGIGLSFAF